jgi:catechol 2,3-dioxygenase
MEQLAEIGFPPPEYRIASSASVGRVRIAVSDLIKAVEFYTTVIGLAVLHAAESLAQLGISETQSILLELQQIEGVKPLGRTKRLGLYHTAFLLPDRQALGSFVQHLHTLGVHYGAGDHLVSEAIYLTDPDGLSVEVYADRPREKWIVKEREIITGTQTVDITGLLAQRGAGWSGAPIGTTIGHLHFYVADLQEASDFYHVALGMNLMTWNFSGALFLAAGQYHHHLGMNIWAADALPAAAQDARLLFWELVLPDQSAVDELAASLTVGGYLAVTAADGQRGFQDPWGIVAILRAKS